MLYQAAYWVHAAMPHMLQRKGALRSRPLGRLRTLDFDQLASIRFRSTNVDHFTNHLISSNLKNKYRKFEGKLSGHSGTGKHTRFRPWGESRAGSSPAVRI